MTGLRGGRWTARLAPDLSLRDVEADGERVLDGVMFAVRDAAWGTAPTEVENATTTQEHGGAEVAFVCRQRGDGTDIRWSGTYRLSGDVLTVGLEGEALDDQEVNRAGLALLHPLEHEGAALHVRTLAAEIAMRFPERIAPRPLATDITGIAIRRRGSALLDIELAGDEFEMEDHRNWTDAGWKTYVTPLDRPAPRSLRRGERLVQRAVLRLGPAPSPARAHRPPDAAVHVQLGPVAGRMPLLATSIADRDLTPTEADGVRALGLAALDVELIAGDRPEVRWERAVAQARATGLPLSVALVVAPDAVPGWIARIAAAPVPVSGLVLFDPASNGSTPELLALQRAARALLPAGAVLGGGTRGYFAELNRLPTPPLPADAVRFSASAEVHHTDDVLVLDTLRGQPATVRDAALIAAGAAVHVGPVTLRQRTDVQRLPPAPSIDDDPELDDPRQHEPFGPVWTLGTVAAMADAARVSLFRAAGWGGIVFPHGDDALAGLIGSLARAAGRPRRALRIEASRRVVGLAFEDDDGVIALLGNRVEEPVPVDAGAAGRLTLAPREVRLLRLTAS